MIQAQTAVARLEAILIDVYCTYRDQGAMPNDRKQYFSGFADALMTLEVIDQAQLNEMIEAANMTVFQMPLQQRREEIDIKADPSMFDSPAWIRQGKTIRF